MFALIHQFCLNVHWVALYVFCEKCIHHLSIFVFTITKFAEIVADLYVNNWKLWLVFHIFNGFFLRITTTLWCANINNQNSHWHTVYFWNMSTKSYNYIGSCSVETVECAQTLPLHNDNCESLVYFDNEFLIILKVTLNIFLQMTMGTQVQVLIYYKQISRPILTSLLRGIQFSHWAHMCTY